MSAQMIVNLTPEMSEYIKKQTEYSGGTKQDYLRYLLMKDVDKYYGS